MSAPTSPAPETGWTAGDRLQIIAGPCAIEGEDLAFRIAESLLETCSALDLPLIFKGSYRKANRSRIDSFTGIGKDARNRKDGFGHKFDTEHWPHPFNFPIHGTSRRRVSQRRILHKWEGVERYSCSLLFSLHDIFHM